MPVTVEKDVVERICDMRDGFKLQLMKEDDGDIIVSILPVDHRMTTKAVQICMSGTQSPRTGKALHALFEAMQQDSIDCPQQ
jgi:hypothetical protein